MLNIYERSVRVEYAEQLSSVTTFIHRPSESVRKFNPCRHRDRQTKQVYSYHS